MNIKFFLNKHSRAKKSKKTTRLNAKAALNEQIKNVTQLSQGVAQLVFIRHLSAAA